MNIRFNSNRPSYNWNNTKLQNQQKLVSQLLGSKKGKISAGVLNLSFDGDAYSKGAKISGTTYTAKGTLAETSKGQCSADEMVRDLERVAKNGFSWSVDGDKFTLGNTGKTCSLKGLQAALNYNNPKTMEVKDNTISFEGTSYYKFTDDSGKEHKVLALAGALTDIFGDYDKEASKYNDFWNQVASKTPASLGLSYSTKEVRKRLADVGITGGFFNINIGTESRTQFLSQGKNAVAVYSKKQYDDRYYNTIQSGMLTRNYEPGTKLKVGGVEYTVDENRKIDVPYGADIWDVEHPSNYKFGVKVE
ncbi:MAG: hypothetical protein Q4D51_12500 [Eubacteriales bacterium]|nr:hypothetical protein [Eubacteriales bacterium]